jgi:hypothetical protein
MCGVSRAVCGVWSHWLLLAPPPLPFLVLAVNTAPTAKTSSTRGPAALKGDVVMREVNKRTGGRKVAAQDGEPAEGDAAAASPGAGVGGGAGDADEGASGQPGVPDDPYTALAKKRVLRPPFDPHNYSRVMKHYKGRKLPTFAEMT